MFSTLLSLALTVPGWVVAPQDPASLLPEDTLIFFGTDSVKAGSLAARKTAMSRIFAESEVRGFLHEPVSAAEGILKVLISQGMAEAGGEGLGGMIDGELDLSLYPDPDAEPLPLGQAMFALTHIDMPTGAPGESMVPDVGLVLAVELLDAEHVAALQGLWGGIPFPSDQSIHAGVTVHEKSMGPDAPVISLAFVDNLAVLSTSPRSLRGVIDRAKGNETSSLAGAADYRALISAGGGLAPGSTTNLVRVPALAGLAKMALAMALAEGEQTGEIEPEMVGPLLALYDSLGLDAIQLVGGLSKVGPDGMIHSTSVVRVDDSRPGLIASLASGGNSVDLSLMAGIPADALSASAAGLGNELVQMYDFVMGALTTFAPEEVGEVNAMIAGALGGKSLRDDLLGNMKDHVVNLSVPGVGFPGTPNTIARVGIDRADDFVEAISNLIGFAAAQLEGAGFPISLEQGEHAGMTFYELDLSQTPVAMAGISPAFALRDGEIVMSDSAPRLRGFLDGAMAEGPRLLDEARFKAFAKGLGSKGDIVAVSYSDTAANFSTMYTQLSAVVPMLAMSGVQLPLDFSKLPRDQAISQHLDISLLGSYRTSDGMYVSNSIASFSFLDLMPLVGVGALLGIGAEMGIEPEAVPMEVDPAQVASDDLRELKASLTIYKISTGGYPGSLPELLTPLDDFPEGAYTGGALPLDPWGHAYNFAMEANPAKGGRVMPKLWSAGANGIDEGGAGDDVLKF